MLFRWLSMLALGLLIGGAPVQMERLHTGEQLGVQVGRGRALTEHLAGAYGELDVIARHPDGSVFYHYVSEPFDLRTNAGADWQAQVMATTGAQPAACNYIALSNDATAPAATDTALTGEITTGGLARAQGTFSHTAGTTSYTVSKTFTATATVSAQKAGMFNAATGGTMCFENTFSAVTLNNGDTLTITWTVNY